jgi:hypothetical protein
LVGEVFEFFFEGEQFGLLFFEVVLFLLELLAMAGAGCLGLVAFELFDAGGDLTLERDYVLGAHPGERAFVVAMQVSMFTHYATVSVLTLSKASVAPRVAQSMMRHSKLELTMNTYTDARLLDTASAIESVNILRSGDVTTDVTTTPVHNAQNESLTDTVGTNEDDAQKQENPWENIDSQGVSDSGRYRTRICDLNDVNVAL